MKRLVLLVVMFVFAMLLGAYLDAIPYPLRPFVLTCQEDEAIIGQGDFSAGLWDSYACVAVDNLR
jgi:hypothetical protein